MAKKASERLKEKTAGLATKGAPLPAPAAAPRMKTLPGQLSAFRLERQDLEAEINTLRTQLEQLLSNQTEGMFDAHLDQLHIIPERVHRLTTEEYQELKGNLSKHRLVHRVVVRPRDGGGYEVISGSNRTTIYRELGRKTIPAILEEFANDSQADVAALFANMFHSSLTDYAKYRGLKMITSTGSDAIWTQQALAEETGVSRSHVAALMIYDDFPKEVLTILDKHPWAMGANIAREFDKLVKKGKLAKVIEALNLVATEELTQAAALRYASAAEVTKAPSKPTPVRVNAGQALYCQLKHAGKSVRLDFQSEEEAAEMIAKLKTVLQARAKDVKDAKPASEEKN